MRANRGTVVHTKISETADLSAFPIPADNRLNLMLDGELSFWDELDSYEFQGRLMHQLSGSGYAAPSIEVTTKDWPESLYLVFIKKGNDVFRKSVVVNH